MRFKPGLLLFLSIWPSVSPAENGSITAPRFLCPVSASHQYIPPEVFTDQQKDETRISAQQVQNSTGDMTTLSGNVLIERNQLRINANRVVFDRNQQKLDIQGQIHIDSQSLGIDADTGWYDIKNSSGYFENSRYYAVDSGYQGSTPQLSIENDKQTRLIDSSFSSCPVDNQDWHLDTSDLKLNHQTEIGTAKHAVLWFKGVPIFYLPYIDFPLGDQRRSGFLMPSFGNSSSTGTEINIPWYWNIAPNQDATLTPRYMSKRGSQLTTNYRYLSHSSHGEFDFEYLPEDKLLNEDRYLSKWRNHSDIGSNIELDIFLNNASDTEYLDDLGSGISISNTTHLERTAKLNYYSDNWQLGVLTQSHQTLDTQIALDDRPYRRLPQIKLDGSDELLDNGLRLSLTSEWVSFEHESGSQETGQRFDIYPRLSWPTQGHAWYLTPAVGLRHTQYDLRDGSDNKLDIEHRQLSISSLDAGLFFERPSASGKYLQTLEPRLYYLNIPFEDQDAIPLIDTGEREFSFAQLFRENRFNGIDRIGDTNQLTLAVTSRILSQDNGQQLMSFSLGEILYFDDRRVSLDNSTPAHTQSKSDIISEISGHYKDWTTRATAQWNQQLHQSDKHSLQLHYQQDDKRLFNIAYRFRRDLADETDNIEQTDVSFSWPINRNYSIMSRWNYSLTEKRDIETLFAIEYDSCCWAMRLLTQRYLTDEITPNHDSSIMLQLIFKGLGSVADKKATDILKRAILGYQSEY